MNTIEELSPKIATEAIENKLSKYFVVSLENATADQIYKSVVMVIRDILLEKRNAFHKKTKAIKGKKVYYLCMEFLLGRSLKNNIYNLGCEDVISKALSSTKFTLEDLYELEPDAGLGNGGLGRLAACFMDGLASQNYPAMGFSLRYEYGLFKQKIIDGWQTELPDVWLPGGEVWLTQRTDRAVKVKFGGKIMEEWSENGMKAKHVDFYEYDALPYDMMISGKDSEAVSVLRLWRAKSSTVFDMNLFSKGDYEKCMSDNAEAELLTKVLYPSDNHNQGKSLRLKQQYFLVSASLQNIVNDDIRRYKDLSSIVDRVCIHINDTHPALCIPELMRILMDEHGYSWESAWDVVTKVVAYTNHTVMVEALESWPEHLIEKTLPRIYNIICEINRRFCTDMWNMFPGDWDKISRMSIINNGYVKMANLSVVASHKVNGVSSLHSEIIKDSIFKDFNDATPNKFTNVTNGIAHRRWLCQSNKELTGLLKSLIGDGFVKNGEELIKLKAFSNDQTVLNEINKIKDIKKIQLAELIRKRSGEVINVNSIFDVQAKRMHEYKRQLLNVMYIIKLYNDLKANPNANVKPKTFIFGAKAAPGYYFAKQIIKLICYLSADINNNPNPIIREKLKVIYLEDYNVTVAETLMPATEISEQISTAGKEASGTGNMKFMINGALTIGTMDGANVEMFEHVGKENIFIFGMTTAEVNSLWANGYNASLYYNQNTTIQSIIESLRQGFNGQSFEDVAKYLLLSEPIADPYMCMADFGDYLSTHEKIDASYEDRKLWAKMSLNNIASSGFFTSDRSIREYADNIWKLKQLNKGE